MERIAEALLPLALEIDLLHPDPANARRHSRRNLEAIQASLERFGQRKPIVVQRQGMIVRAGNGTLAAAQTLGWRKLAAVVVDEGDVAATAYAIADNRSAELAEWDEPALAQLLSGLAAAGGPEASATGFSPDEIDRLLARTAADHAAAERELRVGESFTLAVECRDEADQRELYDRLTAEGYSCRVLTL